MTAPFIEQEINEIDALRNRLESLVHDARKNEVTLRKFQNLELRLLGCSSKEGEGHPMTWFWEGSVHGGPGRCPYTTDSILSVAYVL